MNRSTVRIRSLAPFIPPKTNYFFRRLLKIIRLEFAKKEVANCNPLLLRQFVLSRLGVESSSAEYLASLLLWEKIKKARGELEKIKTKSQKIFSSLKDKAVREAEPEGDIRLSYVSGAICLASAERERSSERRPPKRRRFSQAISDPAVCP